MLLHPMVHELGRNHVSVQLLEIQSLVATERGQAETLRLVLERLRAIPPDPHRSGRFPTVLDAAWPRAEPDPVLSRRIAALRQGAAAP